MSRPAAESGSVLSFTFLDVLTCTMGTLVLLLVVVGERAKRAAVDEARAEAAAKAKAVATTAPDEAASEAPSDPLTAEQAAALLAEARAREAELEKFRAQAVQAVQDEQRRVSHLEDHERRLEHQLAQLHVTLSRLDEAEQKQRVDQEAAKRNLERLKELANEAEKEIKEAQSETAKKRSYAIVPYKGANGTFRRPIYIECSKEAVIIQPEGIRLTPADFDGPLRSGNPLAAAIRAAQEELNSRTAPGADSGDPYPLLVVRPDGAAAYSVALSAISSWDAEFGYEFVDADWNLEFPAPDVRLGEIMAHAVEQARARQELLAKAAPRRYSSRLQSGGRGPGGGGAGMGNGGGEGGGFETLSEEGAGDQIGQNGGDGHLPTGQVAGGRGAVGGGQRSVGRYGESTANANAAGAGGDTGNFAEEFTPRQSNLAGGGSGAAGGGPGAAGNADGSAAGESAAGSAGGAPGIAGASGAMGGNGQVASGGSATSQKAGPGGGMATGAPSASMGAERPPDVHAAPTLASQQAGMPASASTAAASGASQASHSALRSSEADSRGANWANAAASQNATAITRPIQVAVRADELIILADEAAATTGKVVTFNQPKNRVMDELATTVQLQVKEWGVAGRSMYWRPTLVLQVAPGAERQAQRLAELLENSGLDVRLPQQTAARPAGEAAHAR
jgi:chemotaxis protein histidine kinase CheA